MDRDKIGREGGQEHIKEEGENAKREFEFMKTMCERYTPKKQKTIYKTAPLKKSMKSSVSEMDTIRMKNNKYMQILKSDGKPKTYYSIYCHFSEIICK